MNEAIHTLGTFTTYEEAEAVAATYPDFNDPTQIQRWLEKD